MAVTMTVTMAATAAAYAAVAGWVLVEGPVLGAPAVAAGSGAVLVGLAALVGLGEGRVLPLPAVVVGSVLVATGLLTEASEVDAALVLTTSLVLVVVAGGAAPRLALAAGTGLDQPVSLADLGTDVRDDPGSEPGGVDAEAVGADARLGHQILVAVSASVGLLLVLVAPFAVGLGRSGALVAMASCLVVLLHARRHRVRSEVLVGLVSGAGGLGSVAVSVLVLHESWRPVAAAVLVAAGTLVLSQALLSAPPSARRDWLADVAETAALVSLPPLLLLATGVVDVVRG